MDNEQIKQTEQLLKETELKASNLYWKLRRIRKKSKLTVSDHAVVRYLERIDNAVDPFNLSPVDVVAERLITETVLNYYHTLGDGTYPIDNTSTTRVVIQGGVIVTVFK